MKYRTQLGEEINLNALLTDHRAVYETVRKFVTSTNDPDEVSNFIHAEGLKVWGRLPFRERKKLPLRIILRDMESTRLVELGFARIPTYREQLEEIIEDRFNSVSEFCSAAGLSPSFVSHILKGDKDVPIGSLEEALSRIGFRIKFETRKGTHSAIPPDEVVLYKDLPDHTREDCKAYRQGHENAKKHK